MIREPTSQIGIFLFDSSGKSDPAFCGRPESAVHRPLVNRLPRFCHETDTSSEPQAEGDHSLRQALLSQLGDREFVDILLEDKSALLWAMVKSALGAWTDGFASARLVSKLDRDDIGFVEDNWLLSKVMSSHKTMQENISMLKEVLCLLQSRGCATLRCGHGTRASGFVDSLTTDYQHLIEDAEKQAGLLTQRINTLAAIRSIHESGKAIEQSDAIG